MTFQEILGLLPNIFTIENILFILLGTFAGIIIGAIPGMGATMAIALLLPVTYRMAALPSVLLLLAIYCGVSYGGSISSILIGAPGTPSAVATMFDGYPLMKKGNAGLALDMALYGSAFGGFVGNILLLFIAPLIARIAIAFGPTEYFALGCFGLTIIVGLNAKDMRKGLLMGIFGLLLSTIGADTMSAAKRFTFGILRLSSGLDSAAIMIGAYAVVELYKKMKNPNASAAALAGLDKNRKRLSFREFVCHWKTLIRSAVIGSFIGAMPGLGGGTASLLAYNEARKASKHPETYGEGEIDGVCAAETANNAVCGAAMIPMLTLGIPGDMVTAVLMGALIIQGIIPGPSLFVEHAEWVYSTMLGMILVDIAMLLLGIAFIRVFAKIADVKDEVLVPIILVVCVTGLFSQSQNIYTSIILTISSIVGYILWRNGFPVTPLIIGFVLGPIIEKNYRRALMLSGGNPNVFLTHPVCAVLLALTIGTILWPYLKKYFIHRRTKEEPVK